MNRIKVRAVINQHTIDCLSSGRPSILCREDVTICQHLHRNKFCAFGCNKCRHRDDMELHPDRAFIGYVHVISSADYCPLSSSEVAVLQQEGLLGAGNYN